MDRGAICLSPLSVPREGGMWQNEGQTSLPAAFLEVRNVFTPYRGWVFDGWLTKHPGSRVDIRRYIPLFVFVFFFLRLLLAAV